MGVRERGELGCAEELIMIGVGCLGAMPAVLEGFFERVFFFFSGLDARQQTR